MIQFSQSFVGCHSRRHAVCKPAQHLHGPHNIHGILYKSSQVTQCNRFPALGYIHCPAQDKHHKGQKLTDHGQKRVNLYKRLGLFHVQFIKSFIVSQKLLNLKLFSCKSAHSAHTGQILLCYRIQLRVFFADSLIDCPQLSLQQKCQQSAKNHGNGRQYGQLPVHLVHAKQNHSGMYHHLDHQSSHIRETIPDVIHILFHSGHDLTGAIPVKEIS